MKPSERMSVYEWIVAHKQDHGAEKILTGTYMDLEYVRRFVFNRKDYVGCQRIPRDEGEDANNRRMRVFIK